MHLGRPCLLVIALAATGCDRVFGFGPLATADATVDAVPSGLPAIVRVKAENAANATELRYPVEVVDAPDRVLLVTVFASSMCSGAPPGITVTYGNAPLTAIATVVGTPCGPQSTTTVQWLLIGPPVGTADVVVKLTTAPPAVHSSALVVAGVDSTAPTVDVATSSGEGTISSVTVLSAPGDLVVSVVGQGTGIAQPGQPATVAYIQNVDTTTSLNNTAASTLPGASLNVTATWTFSGIDQWQSIATSLRPASR